MKTLRDFALEHALKNNPVFPLKKQGKSPATRGGLWDASADAAEVSRMWSDPDFNIGLRTGDNGLVVVDVDGDKLTQEAIDFLSDLPPTYTVKTGRGEHRYYQAAEEFGNKVGILPGIDIRANGGYVVAAPSVHESGAVYTVSTDMERAPLPESVARLIRASKPALAPASATGDVVEGGRNQYLAQAAGVYQRRGILTLEALLALNETKCLPPLPENEVQAIYESISRYAPQRPIIVEEQDPLILKASSYADGAVAGLMDKEKVKGLSTGFAGLDNMLGGGYRLGEFVALSASAKTGKSSFIAQLISNLMVAGVPVGYGSREMDPSNEVLPNLLSIQMQENVWLTDIDPRREKHYKEQINHWPLYFSPGYGYFPIDDIRRWIEALVKIGVHYFFLDHLHYCLLDPEDYKSAVKLAQDLKALTKELNICLFSVIQPGKLMEGQRLGFNNMRGGAGVAQALDSVLILDRHREDGREVRYISKLTLDIARHKLAKPGHMFFQYSPDTTEFFEVEPEVASDPMPPRYGEE